MAKEKTCEASELQAQVQGLINYYEAYLDGREPDFSDCDTELREYLYLMRESERGVLKLILRDLKGLVQ